jgi:pimeloyl-ACP methyl ester carboxylesterase
MNLGKVHNCTELHVLAICPAADGHVHVPVCLVWSDKDWSTETERKHDRSLLRGAHMVTVTNGGHFLPLDRPQELHELIVNFAGQSSATDLG